MGLVSTAALVIRRLRNSEAITRPEFVVRGDGLPVASFTCTKKPTYRPRRPREAATRIFENMPLPVTSHLLNVALERLKSGLTGKAKKLGVRQ